MAKLNISIPEELKARMTAHDINWSQVAARAFETAIDIEERKTVSMESASIERLRASRAAAVKKRYAEGVGFGKEWALENAEFDELERVAKLAETGNLETEVDYHTAIACAMAGDDQPDGRYVLVMLEELFGRIDPSPDECRGFIDGAAEVFSKV